MFLHTNCFPLSITLACTLPVYRMLSFVLMYYYCINCITMFTARSYSPILTCNFLSVSPLHIILSHKTFCKLILIQVTICILLLTCDCGDSITTRKLIMLSPGFPPENKYHECLICPYHSCLHHCRLYSHFVHYTPAISRYTLHCHTCIERYCKHQEL